MGNERNKYDSNPDLRIKVCEYSIRMGRLHKAYISGDLKHESALKVEGHIRECVQCFPIWENLTDQSLEPLPPRLPRVG